MGNCLKTQLKESVINDALPYLNNLRINVHQVTNPVADNFSISVYTTAVQEMKIVGDGFFTDSTLVTDKGKTANTNTNQKYSNGNYTMLLPLVGITVFSIGSGNLSNMSDWQVGDFDIVRLCKLNSATLNELALKNVTDISKIARYVKNVTQFRICPQPTVIDITPLLDELAESNRTTNYAFQYSTNCKDFYGSGSATRNVHILTAGTKYSVYNGADTQELYVCEKINGSWTRTRS